MGSLVSEETRTRLSISHVKAAKRRREEKAQQEDHEKSAKRARKITDLIATINKIEEAAERDELLDAVRGHLAALGEDADFKNDEHLQAPSDPLPSKPRRSDYPHLSAKEFRPIYCRWKNSRPKAKAQQMMKTVFGIDKDYRLAVARSAKKKQWNADYRQIVMAKKDALKLKLSADGFCSFPECKVAYQDCHVHHCRPNEIWKDGKRRKGRCFGTLNTINTVDHEILRNTDDDGNILLQVLCPTHHAKVTFESSKRTPKGLAQRMRQEYIAKRKIQIGRCQYDKCQNPEDVCSSASQASLFHFDHIYSRGDTTAPPGMRKKMIVSAMVMSTGCSLDDIEAEISKCQLLHATCHKLRTDEQRALGLFHGRPPRN
jgi:hypothetical protein